MQNPVGYTFNPETGRAEMADFAAVLTNKVQLVTFPHVVLSAYMIRRPVLETTSGQVLVGFDPALYASLHATAGTPE